MKPVIFGCAGPVLSDAERAFFEQHQPAGFILFARNIQSPQQLKVLTTDLRLAVGRSDLLMLIDQEGGRVQRMTAPHWRTYPALMTFGKAMRKDADLAKRALVLNCRMIAEDLRRMGVNTNCLPLLDVPVSNADPIIGDRALGLDARQVSILGQLVIDAFMNAGILPVMKHIPGHGRALVDSHHALPTVDEGRDTLINTDFAPFRAVRNCPLGMTAHVVYSTYDPDNTATLSATVIREVIRGHIGFDGLLMTDDISMKALDGDLGTLSARSLAAGCDMVLHCNGDMAEMQIVAQTVNQASTGFEAAIADMVAKAGSAGHADRAALEANYDETMAQLSTHG